MHSLPLFSLLCLSEDYQSLRNASQDTGGSHRLSRMTTGTWMWPSAQNESTGWWFTAGRHKMLPVGRQYLQNLQLTAAESKTCMAIQFKQCVHQSCPLPCLWLKGVCASILGPPITHFHAWWPKELSVQLSCQMKCKPIKQNKAQFLSPNQGTRHACKMQYNLGMQAKDATWHDKALMQAFKQTWGDAN